MQFKSFRIEVNAPEDGEKAINSFLRSHRVLTLERHFVADDGGHWAILVEYAEGGHADSVRPPKRFNDLGLRLAL